MKQNNFIHATEMPGYSSLKNRWLRAQQVWKKNIRKERFAILVVLLTLGTLGSFVYTLCNLIF
jgi:hypothetical protein